MGCFSWIYCDTNKPLRIGKSAHVLIPKEFTCDNKGGRIYETSYDGYGDFNGRDIYELVAEWNQEFLSEEMLRDKPALEKFGGLYDFERKQMKRDGLSEEEIAQKDVEQKMYYYRAAIRRYEESVNRLSDYRNGICDAEMIRKYGKDWKREIGIDIACYDEQNARLPYPIKIAEMLDAIYETQPPSRRDPNQGCL